MSIKCTKYPEDNKEFRWVENDLASFKEFITENGLKCRMDDNFLLGFLRARKYNIKQSFQLLKNYYSLRIMYPQIFKNLLPSKLEHFLNLNVMQFLPQPDQKGRDIFIIQARNWNLSVGSATDYLRSCLLFWDFQLNFHRTQENGVVFIIDGEGLTPKHFFQSDPELVYFLTAILFKETFQLRIKEIHYVNVNVILKGMLKLMTPQLLLKWKRKIFLHSEMSTVHKFIYPQYLPIEFGGELPKLDPTDANEMIKENEEFFQINEEYLKKFQENNQIAIEKSAFILDNESDELKSMFKEIEMKFKHFTTDSKYVSGTFDKELEIELKQLLEN